MVCVWCLIVLSFGMVCSFVCMSVGVMKLVLKGVGVSVCCICD